MRLFEVGYQGINTTDHLSFSQAEAVGDDEAAAVCDMAGDMADNILKVTPNSVFVAGYEAADKLFNLKYGAGQAASAMVANNDSDSISTIKSEFAYAGAKFRLGLDFPVAAAHGHMAPQPTLHHAQQLNAA